jgi:hypothetical protein
MPEAKCGGFPKRGYPGIEYRNYKIGDAPQPPVSRGQWQRVLQSEFPEPVHSKAYFEQWPAQRRPPSRRSRFPDRRPCHQQKRPRVPPLNRIACGNAYRPMARRNRSRLHGLLDCGAMNQPRWLRGRNKRIHKRSARTSKKAKPQRRAIAPASSATWLTLPLQLRLPQAQKGFNPLHMSRSRHTMPARCASKHYILLKELPPNVATSPKLYAATADRSRIMVPFLQFLTASFAAQPKEAQRPRHVRVTRPLPLVILRETAGAQLPASSGLCSAPVKLP